MPSKKQRRRRAKERRHDYELVYVDEEGREVDAAEVEPEHRPAKERRSDQLAKTSSGGRSAARRSSAAVRPVPPPSWTRVIRRAAIFAPFMLITIWLLGRGRVGAVGVFVETAWLLLLFIPFSYVIDRMMYRRYLRQTGDESAPPARRQPRA